MSAAKTYRPQYTVSDYVQWEGDWELWNGIPVSMTPAPFGPHQKVAAKLVVEFSNQVSRHPACHCEVLYELDWHVSNDTVVRPDVCVLCDGVPETFLCKPPQLIAEILSPSTSTKDRTAKLQLYEEQRVAYYLILDPASKSLQAYELRDVRYNLLEALPEYEFRLHDQCVLRLDPKVPFA